MSMACYRWNKLWYNKPVVCCRYFGADILYEFRLNHAPQASSITRLYPVYPNQLPLKYSVKSACFNKCPNEEIKEPCSVTYLQNYQLFTMQLLQVSAHAGLVKIENPANVLSQWKMLLQVQPGRHQGQKKMWVA